MMVLDMLIVSCQFARRILGWLECQFHSCGHASDSSSLGPPNSTTWKGLDNRCGEDTTFDVLPSQKPSVVQIKSLLITGKQLAIEGCGKGML